MKMCIFCIVLIIIQQLRCGNSSHLILNQSYANDDYVKNLKCLLTEIVNVARLERCFVVITDDFHHVLYDAHLFQRSHHLHSYYYMRIAENEDLLAPHYHTVRILKEIHAFNCDLHLITLLNTLQVKRFLYFIEKHRILNTRQKFVLLYDARLFETDMLHIWSNMISSVFLKRHLENRFSILTISYPSVLAGVAITTQLMKWTPGKRLKSLTLFPDKSSNLKAFDLPVVVFEHVPMVKRANNSCGFAGLELEIIHAIAAALNFQPQFYESTDSETERWGRELPNGTFTGLIGQMTSRKARLAIGDLHLYRLYATVMDLSLPHSYDCLTFLTPESSQNNAWLTLIQPFSGAMWAGVLLSLIIVGTIFYIISFLHALLLCRRFASCNFFSILRKHNADYKTSAMKMDLQTLRDPRFRSYLARLQFQAQQEDIFDNYANCILLTYSMLTYVSLPRMPRNWPLRVLTGWYWLYCILVTVIYRASLTAILANPVPRITIDSLAELVKSHITAATLLQENKIFFDEAFDESAQEIGLNMEVLDDISSVTELIAKGQYAYYDNAYFLRHLRVTSTKRHTDFGKQSENLHIMRDCVVRMPVVLGLEKNSPLKPHIDKYLQRLIEGGLVSKWRRDAIADLPAEELPPQEALMDLGKIWSGFVALAFGYMLGICAIAAEYWHFNHVVRKHPIYDVYNTKLYYNFKRRFPNFKV